VCGGTALTDVLEIPRVPVHCNLLWPTREEALAAPTAAIRLAFCGACGHTFNRVFDPQLMVYSQRYENSLHFSPRFQEHARSLAAHLIDRYDLHDKDIIEIGCGKGEFLTLLCALGQNRGLGFDPSYIPDEARSGPAPGIKVIPHFYSDRYADHGADLICCRHVLEHLHDPRGFLRMLRRVIGRRKTVVVFEVPNGRCTLRDLAIWDIIYEHYSYFSSASLASVFRASGFGVSDRREWFDGQFLCIEAVPGEGALESDAHAGAELEELGAEAATFGENYGRKLADWRRIVDGIVQRGHRAVVWGAGSKGVSFLNALDLRSGIEYVVDLNPRKQGMYVAGTGQKIVPPSVLRHYRPAIVIVMNRIYQTEIRGLAASLGLQPEFLIDGSP
jgi:SAM-dependent methyltransferase